MKGRYIVLISIDRVPKHLASRPGHLTDLILSADAIKLSKIEDVAPLNTESFLTIARSGSRP